MFKRFIAAAAVSAVLAGCASTPNPIDTATRQGAFVKDATIAWSVEDGKRVNNPNYLPGKDDMIARLEAAVENEFKTSPAGGTPLIFKVDLKHYSRANAAVGQLIGVPNAVSGDVHVIRESDGKEIGVYKNVMGMYAGGGGLIGLAVQATTKPDVPQVMADTFAANLRARFESK